MADIRRNSVESWKKIYSMDYCRASDSELKSIIDTNREMFYGLSFTPEDCVKKEKLLGAIEACEEILLHRYNEDKRIEELEENVVDEWNNNLAERRYKAILNLKTAATPNGQLIINILLYDNGKTRDELATWCDELETIDDAEFDNLLSELVKEGVIEYNEEKNKYFFKRQVTGSLFPELDYEVNPLFVRLCEMESNKDMTKSQIAKKHAKILLISEALNWADNPVDSKEIKELIDRHCRLAIFNKYYEKYGINIYEVAGSEIVTHLTHRDIKELIHFYNKDLEYFKIYKVDLNEMYYFTMVGEKEGE